MSAAAARTVGVAGVRITNPGRMLFDELGLTKAALARYYEGVAEWLLAELRDRPLSLRCARGAACAPIRGRRSAVSPSP